MKWMFVKLNFLANLNGEKALTFDSKQVLVQFLTTILYYDSKEFIRQHFIFRH